MTKLKKDAQTIVKLKRTQQHRSNRNSITPMSSEHISMPPNNLRKKIELENLKLNINDFSDIKKFKLPKISEKSNKFVVLDLDESPDLPSNQNVPKKINVFRDIDTLSDLKINQEQKFDTISPRDIIESSGTSFSEETDKSWSNSTFQSQKILSNWNTNNNITKIQKNNICQRINRKTTESILTKNETRIKKEFSEVVDRIMSQINLTPTLRGFFKLPDRICKKYDYSTCMTLMKREGETDEPMERIGYSKNICIELNYNEDLMDMRNSERKKFYETLKDYKNLLNQIEHHYPEFETLEVVGSSVKSNVDKTEPNPQESEINHKTKSKSPHASQDDQLCISLIIADTHLHWEDNSTTPETVLEVRVLFECYQRLKAVSYLEMENNGTASVYYSWELISNKNIFDIPLANIGVQTFYFDQSDGVLIPGQKISFPFTFKSVKDGIYQEKWHLKTFPQLNGGSNICVILHGIAVQNDIYQKIQNDQLKLEYEHKRNTYLASIVQEILDNVKTPPRPSTPIEETLDDKVKFEKQNEHYFFNDEIFNKLNNFYNVCADKNSEWNYSLDDLHSVITDSSLKNEKSTFCTQFHDYLSKLKKSPKFSSKLVKLNIMQTFLINAVYTISSTSRNVESNSTYLRTIYEERPVTGIYEKKKISKTKSGLLLPKDDSVTKETNNNQCANYFAEMSNQMVYNATYQYLVKVFNTIEDIFEQM